jgi:hypothetical protein
LAGLLFGCKAGASAKLHVMGELIHRILCDRSPFSECQRSLRAFDRSLDLDADTLTLLPHGKSFLHGVFLPAQSARLNSLTDKRLLVGCELDFHSPKRRVA